MLVSILVANYNHGRFLAEAVRSVVDQTYQDIELIFVDDGSTDHSLTVIRELLDEFSHRFARAKLLRNEENQGKLHALNRAVKEASGEAAVIVDADDYLHISFLERMVSSLREESASHRQIAFVYSDCYLVDECGATISVGRCAKFDKELLQTRSFIPECGLTYTSVLKSIIPLDESIRVGTKHHKWKKVVALGFEGVWLPIPLFYYRMHGSNLSGIGSRILQSKEQGESRESILSGYWPTEGGHLSGY